MVPAARQITAIMRTARFNSMAKGLVGAVRIPVAQSGPAVSPSIAYHSDAAWEQVVKSLTRLLRSVLLKEGEQTVDENDEENREPELWHAGDSCEVQLLHESNPKIRAACYVHYQFCQIGR
jgi:hypothetical protein